MSKEKAILLSIRGLTASQSWLHGLRAMMLSSGGMSVRVKIQVLLIRGMLWPARLLPRSHTLEGC